jgi:hypothetical protein
MMMERSTVSQSTAEPVGGLLFAVPAGMPRRHGSPRSSHVVLAHSQSQAPPILCVVQCGSSALVDCAAVCEG